MHWELFSNPFVQMALLGGILASFASGIMGSFVVIKKIASLSGSIAHSILGGIGFALWLKYNCHLSWVDPIYGAIGAALISSFLMGWVHLNFKQKEDAVIAAIWSTGMAVGVIFVSLIKGYKADFSNFLFGNILLISKQHLLMLFILDLLILFLTILFYRRFMAICFDEEQAFLQKVPTHLFYFLLLSLISLSIVLLIQVIGTILVIALLTIPPTIVRLFTGKFSYIIAGSVIIGILFNVSGIGLSYLLNTPPGATIALTAASIYLLALLFKKKLFLNKSKTFEAS